ncbi:MAG: SPASM domain-containing protein, partial [Anaerolineaceae bacterium]|nr:SPASM domain-containing protein [Anaerolineaceae bacterium]
MSSILSSWLHITDSCNLSCPYCYVVKRGSQMSEDTGLAAVDAVVHSAQQHGYKGIKLKYAGGEPTLKFPLIQQLHEYARRLTDKARLELQEVVLSNGVMLTSAMLAYLAQEDMRLMISLDGLDVAQGKLRCLADGRSSLPFVVQGVELALAAGLKPYLSTTVTRVNINSLPEVVAFALDHELPLSLNLYRENPCSAENTGLVAGPEELIAGLLRALKVIEERLPPYRLIDGLLDLVPFSGPQEHPCAAGRDYLVIDTQGQIARCQMVMDEVVSDIHADDPLQDVRDFMDGFQNVSVDEIVECRDCPWKYYCAGGCPLLAGRRAGQVGGD